MLDYDPKTGYLPPGIHDDGWCDVTRRFATAKSLPGDYDGAWETAGVDPDRLDQVLLDFSSRRAAMKAKYLGDLLPASATAAPGVL